MFLFIGASKAGFELTLSITLNLLTVFFTKLHIFF